MSSTPISKYLFDKLAEESKASTPRDNVKNTMDKYSSLLEYSPLEGQVMPQSVDSSPDIELQHRKLFSKGVSPLASNITLLNNYCSEEESDESFVRMEKLIRGPFKSEICNTNKQTTVPETPESKTEMTDDKNEISPINKSVNMSSLINGFNLMKVDVSSSIKQSPSMNSFNDSLDTLNDKKEDISDLNTVPVPIMQKDSLENTLNVSLDVDPGESLKFNDTLEEVDYFLKQGAKNLVVEEPKKTSIPIVQEKIKETIPKPQKESSYLTPKPKIYVNDRLLKSNTINRKLPTPTYKLTPFKIPDKSTLTPRNNTPKLKIQNSDKKFTPNRKYDDIKSPIGHYINHSPTVPLLKNVSPARNYWDRVPREPLNRSSRLYKNTGKENAHLPEKAYKSSKVTKVVERPVAGRLPHNNKITTMMENNPKVMIIKHIKREKLVNLPPDLNDNKKRVVEDSFAHLPVDCVDVSHCVVNPATRTKTLK